MFYQFLQCKCFFAQTQAVFAKSIFMFDNILKFAVSCLNKTVQQIIPACLHVGSIDITGQLFRCFIEHHKQLFSHLIG